ncbi:hypothetical protein PAXINDRAFT_121288 [Paxillus involutus ATCC 200175]|uniref:CxC6 like cysteine cluster associated with KDZ domain-containing protein n=1 Tax=Paxillus involutus ATCC 200175 TaxID=664439 RepID=A0A0C9T732_PAXIN|nr:hypothetical protein PAXINDRAFT_121288 [Paxillus involutus ATCC 200175]
MLTLRQLIASLPQSPTPILDVSLGDILAFIKFSCVAKPAIQQSMQDVCHPPASLPPAVSQLLAGVLALDVNMIQNCWTTLRSTVWHHDEVTLSAIDVKCYNAHGRSHGIAYGDLYPPTRVCLSPDCPNFRSNNDVSTLSDPVTHKATRFTLRAGVLPIHTTSTYCRKCLRRYHHNYIVQKSSSSRTYYCGVLDVIQVATHFFIDTAVLELFANAKVFGWLSSMNCARIYNTALGNIDAYIVNNRLAFGAVVHQYGEKVELWPCSLQMRDEDVLNGFFIYSLLLDKAERQSQLVLSHDSQHRVRIDAALIPRNKEMEGIGQEAYPHACDKCFVVVEDNSGCKMKIQVAVCDGNTIGHPCCAVHDCKKPLDSHRLRFCSDHQHLGEICAVDGCNSPCASGCFTCDHAEHRQLELAYYKPTKALFQLRARLKKAGVSIPTDSMSGSEDTETVEESLIMRPCGVILARATFYGSEAVSAVNDFAKAVFPTPQSTPEYFIFDNNCKLRAHQEAIRDTHFSQTGFPVDVFHFNSKHKETDLYCQRHCNPAAFPDLLENGKWRFNTSICEQTNVWLGGYQAILRSMSVHRYNFYLDEMIKRRNRYIISELEKSGHNPWTIPIDSSAG